MVVIIVGVIFWTFNLSPAQLTANVSIDVPNVVGQTYTDGSALLIDSNLEPQKITEASDSVPEGVIIRTDPEAGTTVSPGLQVKVYVSIGETPVKVPEVNNMLEADAIAALTAAGLVHGKTTQEFSAEVKGGVVVRSDPEGGSERRADGSVIRAGDEVNLVVSNGRIVIPDVTGMAIAAANAALTPLQLTIKINSDLGCSGGTVADQSIVGEQPQKSTITLRICVG
jgi:beta-lactam-binding protein with PASTA domain